MLSALVAFSAWVVAAGHELAVVRPFATADEVRRLSASFQSWNTVQPCGAETRTSVDLYLVYSRAFKSNSDAAAVTKQLSDSFRRHDQAWHKCFRELHVLSADLSQEEDVYDIKHQDANPNWVNGPNAVFRYILSHFLDSSYSAFFLMELDAVPKKSHWLDQFEREVLDYPAAVIRGSRYRGDKWNKYLSSLPESLRVHINGNAIYFTAHPMLSWLNDRLHLEARTPRKSIPYDVRIAQLLVAGRRKTNTACSEAWDAFVPYGSHEPYASDSKLIGNYASTLLNSSFDGGEYINHISPENVFQEVDQSKVTLGVEYLDDESFLNFEFSIDNNHPFRSIVVLKREADLSEETEFIATPGGPTELRWKPAQSSPSRAICDMAQHVSTEFFVFTDTSRRLRGNVSVLVDGNRPLLPYIPADSVLCRSGRSCTDSMAKASELFGVSLQDHYALADILFKTSSVQAFCAAWEEDRAFTGDDYIAWLSASSNSGLGSQYAPVDRGEKGWRTWTLPQSRNKLGLEAQARQLQQDDNSTNNTNGTCENITTQQDCQANSLCTWTNGDCITTTVNPDETVLSLMTLIVNSPPVDALTTGMSTSAVDTLLANLKTALDPVVKAAGGEVVRGVEFTVQVNYAGKLDFDPEPSNADKCTARTTLITVVCSTANNCKVTVTAANMPTCSRRLMEESEDAAGSTSFRGASRQLQTAYELTYEAQVNITDGADVASITNPADPAFTSQVTSQLNSSVSGFTGAPAATATVQTLVRVLTAEAQGTDYAAVQSAITTQASQVTNAFAQVLGASPSSLTTTTDLCLGRTCNGQGDCVDGVCQCALGWAQPNCVVQENYTTTEAATTPMILVATLDDNSDDETAVAVLIALGVVTVIALLLALLFYFLKPDPVAGAAAGGAARTFI